MIGLLEDDSTAGAPRVLMDQPGPQNLVVVDWGASSKQGKQRLRNEDNWGQLGPVFVVADGMGGLEAGDIASRVAARGLVSQWFGGNEMNPVEVARSVNGLVCEALADVDSGGSTLSALRIAHDQATVVHIGDSRIYRVRSGHAELMSRDHNLRTELLSAGIEPKASQNFGPLRALTSYLGMAMEDLQVDVRSVALRNGDVLVLCTDGVFDGLSHNAFVDAVYEGMLSGAETTAANLTAGVRPDDATAIVIQIGTADGQQGTLS